MDTQTISSGSSNPALVSFTVPADGSSNIPVWARFQNTTTCGDQSNFDVPTPCAPFTCSLIISDVDVGPCVYDATTGLSTSFVDVELTWAYPPSGELIEVTLNGQTLTLDPSTTTSPDNLIFYVPAVGSLNNPITAQFETTTDCMDTDDYNSPISCNPQCPNNDCVNIQVQQN